MYGPPPDPRQRIAPVEIFDSPEAYVICFIIGALLSLSAVWKKPGLSWRAAFFVAGQTVILTAPLAFFVDTYVYGSFPTVDKAGTLALFLEGAHWRLMAHPLDAIHDPAASVIGVHVGHLWITEIFGVFLSDVGAFNAQALLCPALAWWSAWWLFHGVTQNPRVSMLMAFPYGMGLHLFRDLNWYAIETAAIFWIPLFLGFLVRFARTGRPWHLGLVFCLPLCAWMSLSMGLLNCFLLVLSMVLAQTSGHPRRHDLLRYGSLSILLLFPLLVWQWFIMQGSGTFAAPNHVFPASTALDTFSFYPLSWSRLEGHRALNVIALAVGLWGFWRARWIGIVRFAALASTLFFFLSLGPSLWEQGPENPFFMAARAILPGSWWMAKPEVFFHIPWLLILAVAAFQADRSGWGKRTTTALYGLFLLAWLLMIRTHPAYPPMTMPLDEKLDADWETGVSGQ